MMDSITLLQIPELIKTVEHIVVCIINGEAIVVVHPDKTITIGDMSFEAFTYNISYLIFLICLFIKRNRIKAKNKLKRMMNTVEEVVEDVFDDDGKRDAEKKFDGLSDKDHHYY